jgi:phospholipase C
MKRRLSLLLSTSLAFSVAACSGAADSGSDTTDQAEVTGATSGLKAVKTVFIIVLENHSWSSIRGSSKAPFLNGLLPVASHAEAYSSPPGNHPSERNYIWLESGDNLGITADSTPSTDHQATHDHLVSQLERAGVTWKSYQEDIDGASCPLGNKGLYVARHNPMVFFDDVTDGNDPHSQHCIDHVRPFTELKGDLEAGTTAQFNFITPNLCHDMHGQVLGITCQTFLADLIKDSDQWLSSVVPMITSSDAFKNNGALFITWDEGDEKLSLSGDAEDGPIGMIVLSPLAKGHGYSNTIPYTHSSTLRTFETIFGVPFLRDAAKASDLGDLFKPPG